VVADGGLTEPERFDQVARAGFVVGLCLDQAEQAKPSRVGDDAECSGETFRVVGVECALEERRAGFSERGAGRAEPD
jgi:hypothetical protein